MVYFLMFNNCRFFCTRMRIQRILYFKTLKGSWESEKNTINWKTCNEVLWQLYPSSHKHKLRSKILGLYFRSKWGRVHLKIPSGLWPEKVLIVFAIYIFSGQNFFSYFSDLQYTFNSANFQTANDKNLKASGRQTLGIFFL